MVKIHTTLSIDSELMERAKERGCNISLELEKALKAKLVLEKKDLPASALSVKCFICNKEIIEGYVCEQKHKVLCLDCGGNIKACILNASGEHEHTKFSFPDNQNTQLIK